MYQPIEIARFALMEFERGLEGLSDEEARTRVEKSDGTKTNAIAWTVAHIAGHWLNRPGHLERYGFQSDDPTPPSWDDARNLLAEAKDVTERWLPNATGQQFATTLEGTPESIGTGVMRATLHTWFHIGEINAIRQQLGHEEIPFVGKMAGKLEWRNEADGNAQGYRPDELARFAFSEFERGLEGLMDEEARTRVKKAGGTEMNAISWIMGHIAGHWRSLSAYAAGADLPFELIRFVSPFADPAPPPLDEMQKQLDRAKGTMDWLATAEGELLASSDESHMLKHFGVVGTALMNAVLHTWFHIGEINAIRQTLGHAPIDYVGPMLGRLEWRCDG